LGKYQQRKKLEAALKNNNPSAAATALHSHFFSFQLCKHSSRVGPAWESKKQLKPAAWKSKKQLLNSGP
jgi:hypothetical protein